MDDSGVEDGRHGGRVGPCPGCGLADRVAGVPAVHHEGRGNVLQVTGAGDGRTLRAVDSGLARALAPAPSRSWAPLVFAWLGMTTLLATVALTVFALIGAVAEQQFDRARDTAAEAAAEPEEPEPWSTWITDEDGMPILVRGPEEAGDTGAEDPTFEAGPAPVDEGAVSTLLALPWLGAGVTGGVTVLMAVLGVRKHRQNTKVLAGRPAAERLWARAWYCARCGTVHFPAGDGSEAEAGPLALAEFRRMVWSEGGYGHLAARSG